MKFSQETLMAYADGELDAATRSAIEAAMAEDPAIAAELARHRALRDELRGAFSGALSEDIPARLLDAANKASARRDGDVVDMASARAAKEVRASRARWSWPQWTSIAASLLIGVLGGRALLQSESSDLLATDDGRLVATGALSKALTSQIGAQTDAQDKVRIGLSFRARDGNYCRTFALPGDSAAGVACRDNEHWQIQALARVTGETDSNEYRQAGAPLPPAIVQVVESTIDGDALDAEQEAALRARNWSAK
jgi:anti-sigma factor RsiW